MRILLRTAYSLTAYSSIVCSAKPGELPCQRHRAEPCDWLTNKLVSIRMDRPWIRKISNVQALVVHRQGREERTDKKKGRRLNLLRPRLEAPAPNLSGALTARTSPSTQAESPADHRCR